MKAIITAIGKDEVGILAAITAVCADCMVNIEEVTQQILAGMYTMIMTVDAGKCNVSFSEFQEKIAAAGDSKGVEAKVTRQELYEAMHII